MDLDKTTETQPKQEQPSQAASEAVLHQYVDAEFRLNGLESPAREQELRLKLESFPGVKGLTIFEGQVIAHYEPAVTSEKQLEDAIRATGFEICESHLTSSSILTNVLAENKPDSLDSG